MKIAFNALKRYVPLTVSAEECADTLINLGFEVEGIEFKGYSAKGPVVVGKVLERAKHPNADRLSVCKVQIDPQTTKTIVCGANNFQAGDLVPVALPGSMVNGYTLQKTKMRGVESEGMMCSGRELGLCSNSEGLLILPEECVVGEPIEKYFSNSDVIFDLTITANRGDCLSYLGIARELSAWYNLNVCYPNITNLEKGSIQADSKLQNVKVLTEACPFYSAWAIRGIRVEQSPDWLRNFLENSGMRPINNIVDITNFVMLESGQPLHAFDLHKIEGNTLYVRKATTGEKFDALNGQNYTLPSETLVIADDNKALAIAGLIGGNNSEVSQHTTEILLESAYFMPHNVRSAANQLGLSTESSYRFERNIDSSKTEKAALRAIALLKELNPSIEVYQIHRIGQPVHTKSILTLPINKIKSVSGIDIPAKTISEILQRLEFKVLDGGNLQNLNIEVPTFRNDILYPIDLVEEILRIYGTDKIPSNVPTVKATVLEDDRVNTLRTKIIAFLTAHGFEECYTNSLEEEKILEMLLEKSTVNKLKVSNPLTQDHVCLRYSLIPGLLGALKFNWNQNSFAEKLFECGRVFRVNDKGVLTELFATTFLVAFPKNKNWLKRPNTDSYYLQEIAASLLKLSGYKKENVYDVHSLNNSQLWQENYASTVSNWFQKGWEITLGNINIQFLQNWFENEVFLACECLWLPERLKGTSEKRFQAFSEFPFIRKDLSVVIDKNTPAEEVRSNIEKTARKAATSPVEVTKTEIFDVYPLQENNKKSLALSLMFTSNSRTLTDAEVNLIFSKIQEMLEAHFKYNIRKATV